MKAEELMIGDLLQYRGRFAAFSFRVERITKRKIGYHVEPGKNRITYLQPDEVQPIPLTAEILEKNGFEVTRNMSSSRNKDVWSLRVSKNKIFHIIEHHNKKQFPYFWIEMGSNSDIKYVHQLQHALRLCGIEKEINL